MTESTLRICWSATNVRPEDFHAKPDTGRNLFVRFARTQRPAEPELYEPEQVKFNAAFLNADEGKLTLSFSTPVEPNFNCHGVQLSHTNFGTELMFLRSPQGQEAKGDVLAVQPNPGSASQTVGVPWVGESLYIRGSKGRRRITEVDPLSTKPEQESSSTIELAGCRVSAAFDAECRAIITVENPTDKERQIEFEYEILSANSLIPTDTRSVLRGKFKHRIAPNSTQDKVVPLEIDENPPPLFKSFRDRIQIRVMTKGAEPNWQKLADWPVPRWLKQAVSEDSLENLVAKELVKLDQEEFEIVLNQYKRFSQSQRRGFIQEFLNHNQEFLVAKILSELDVRSRSKDFTYLDNPELHTRIMKMVEILRHLQQEHIRPHVGAVISAKESERRSRDIALWFKELSPGQAADYLTEFAKSGNEEWAKTLFDKLQAKQQKAILERIRDRKLRDTLKRTSATEETLERQLISQ